MTIKDYKLKSLNPLFEVYKIPFNAIEKANVSLKDKDSSWSLKEHSDEQDWDIAVNGAMFSNGNKLTDKYYYWNITDLVINGVFNRGGNYSNKGIAFGNPFAGVSAYWSTTENCIGKPVDFIGSAPTLIIDGKINMDMKNLGSSFATNMTQRTAIGIDKANIYILTTRIKKANLTQVANELLAQGCLWASDLDGGGSTAIKIGDDYFTQGRNITSAFGIKLKDPIVTKPIIATSTTTNHESLGSLLIKTDLTTVNFVKGRTGSIDYIVVHYTANDNDTDEANGNYFDDTYRGASAHYFVDEDSVTQVVKDSDTAWHCNDTQAYTNGGATFKKLCNNNNSIGIELCSDKDANGDFIITKATQENAQILIRHLMTEHNITIDKIIRHFDVSGKICPEPFVEHPEQWDSFKKAISQTIVPANTTIYKVQLGAYGQKRSAEGLMQKLTALGYKCTIILEDQLYKVQLGAFSVKANALAVEAQLEKLGYQVYIQEVIK